MVNLRRALAFSIVAVCIAAAWGCGRDRRGRGGRTRGDAGPTGCAAVTDVSASSDGSFHYLGETGGAGDEGACGGRGSEAILRYVATRDGTLMVTTQNPRTEFDTVLYVRTTCDDPGSELVCDDDGGGGTRSRLEVEVYAGETLYVYVDSFERDGGGELEVTGVILETLDGGLDAGGVDAGPAPACSSPADLRSMATVEADGSLRVSSRVPSGASATRGSCGGSGVEAVYRYVPTVSGTLTASTDDGGTTFDTVVYVRTTCDDDSSEITCDDDGGGGTRSVARGTVSAGVPVYIFVDAFSSGSGAFVLLVRVDEEMDAGFDGGFDAGSDAGSDAGLDAGSDAGFDAGSCPTGFADCNGLATDGCETSIRTASNCGGCGLTCSRVNATATCSTGTCQILSCLSGYDDCNGVDADGCERNLSSDVNACGACTTSCPSPPSSTRTCSSGSCGFTCDVGTEDCNGTAGDGCERATSSDPDACGSCTTTCPARANAARTCSSGVCGFSCDTGYDDCNGTAGDGCERATGSDPDACGSCTTTCPARTNAARTCSSGACGFACNTGYQDCNGTAGDGCERHLSTDPDACGSCTNVCPTRANASRTCASGACGFTCNVGFDDCNGGASDGCETDLMNDRNNCNACGNSCPGSQQCCAGTCRPSC